MRKEKTRATPSCPDCVGFVGAPPNSRLARQIMIEKSPALKTLYQIRRYWLDRLESCVSTRERGAANALIKECEERIAKFEQDRRYKSN